MTKPTAPEISVWLIEDNRAFRHNAATAINESAGMRCAQTFRSCEDALEMLKREAPPDVALMDIGLPGMSGIEGIRLFRERAPATEVVMLTVFAEEDKIFRAICAGASGYLLKTCSMDELADAIRLATAGGSPINPHIARRVLGFFNARSPVRPDYGLTDREEGLLELLVTGLARKQIADRLAVSMHTVDMHLRHIYQKLQVNTATSAVAKALREKLV